MEASHDGSALTLAVVSGFLMFAGGFWVIVSLGQWALAPIDRPRLSLRIPTQFSLRECLLLMTQTQLAVAAGLWWGGDASNWSIAAACVIAIGLIAAWWHGAGRLSRCKVTCPLRRGVFLLLVTPLACATIIAALWLNGRAVMDLCLGQHWPLGPWLAGNLVILATFLTCRLINIWVLSDLRSQGNPVHGIVDLS